jgi:hypothetical protein
MIKSKLVQNVYGKIRIIELAGVRHYVKRTNLKTWVVSDNQILTLDSMVKLNGEYHFDTLNDLHIAATKQFGAN